MHHHAPPTRTDHRLHPDRFRTEACQYGAACKRPVCFFAHGPEQLRTAPPDLPAAELCWQTGASLRFGCRSDEGASGSDARRPARNKRTRGGGRGGSSGDACHASSVNERHMQKPKRPQQPAAQKQLLLYQQPQLHHDNSGGFNSAAQLRFESSSSTSSTMQIDLLSLSAALALPPGLGAGSPGAGGMQLPQPQLTATRLADPSLALMGSSPAGVAASPQQHLLQLTGAAQLQPQQQWLHMQGAQPQPTLLQQAQQHHWQQQQQQQQQMFSGGGQVVYSMLQPQGTAMMNPATAAQSPPQVLLLVVQHTADGSFQPMPPVGHT